MSQKVIISGINTDSLPKLNAKESEEMLRQIKLNGRQDLRSTFIEGNMRLVLSMVQRFRTDKVSADDLFQVGMLGLIKSLDNFDVSLNVRFSTYAVPMILGEMRRYVRESTAMKVGRSLRDIAYRAMQAREKLELGSVNEASLSEIAAEINEPYADVVDALDSISDPLSIYDSAYSDEEDNLMVVDTISDKVSVDDMVNKIALDDEMNKLPDLEKSVLNLRYFQGKTQMEISQELDMSQAQISRLERNAITKLRKAF